MMGMSFFKEEEKIVKVEKTKEDDDYDIGMMTLLPPVLKLSKRHQ